VRIALVVPGGVDPSGEYRVIPALLALIERLGARHDLEVFALMQLPEPAKWRLGGVRVCNVGTVQMRRRAIAALRGAHQRQPFDLVHSMWSGSSGLVAVAAAGLMRRPSLVHVTGGEVVSLPAVGYGGGRTWRGRLREAVVLRLATCVSATSRPLVAELARLGIRAARVPLGVDLRRWPPRAPPARQPQGEARLLHVGTLNAVKDQATMLHALARLRAAGQAFHLDLVGDDILGGRMQGLARELGLAERVTFHGFLTQAQLRPLFERAALLVMSSRHEAGPFVALEAAIAGVPTVGTAVGHLSEWAPQAACTVSPGDAAGLATAVAQLLGDEPRRLAIAHAAQARALAEDADFTVRAFEALYAQVV